MIHDANKRKRTFRNWPGSIIVWGLGLSQRTISYKSAPLDFSTLPSQPGAFSMNPL
jgi:hypothetical protein